MDVHQFIEKWSRADRTERQAAQEHFIDLCRMLGEPTPNEAADPGTYSFEKGASKIDGSPGFADVWKRGHFGWEYKKDRANLDRAYQQLQLYSVALENPPLLVVSDTKRFASTPIGPIRFRPGMNFCWKISRSVARASFSGMSSTILKG
jgi:hypothetical protein